MRHIFIFSLMFIMQTSFAYTANFNLVDEEESSYYLSLQELDLSISESSFKPLELKKDFEDLKKIIPEILAFRVESVHLFQALESKIINKQPYSGRELRGLQNQFLKRLEIRVQLEGLVKKHIPYLRAYNLSEEKRLTGVTILLASLTQLIDGYREVLILFNSEDRLRRVLNEDLSHSDKVRTKLRTHFKQFEKLSFLFNKIHALRIYHRRRGDIRTKFIDNKNLNFLSDFIEESATYKVYEKNSGHRTISEIVNFFTFKNWLNKIRSKDKLFYSVRSITGFFSKLFGNFVGQFQMRRGKLFQDREVEAEISKKLQPFDIIFEKTPFRLTDHFIPGYWGHVAIWIGTESDLRVLNIWDNPLVKKYYEKIQSKQSIVEALRAGVQMNSLNEFMDVDDFAIIRNNEISYEEMQKGILTALEQVGKNYDFNYDVETQDSLVCSELIYMSYVNQQWGTSRHLGRWDIIPDDVAEQSFGDGNFSVAALYHDGEKVLSNLSEKMKFLIQK